MKIAELQSILNSLPVVKPALDVIKNGNIDLILNDADNNNKGYHISFSYGSLRIERFQREPYKTFNILNGADRLTIKQQTFIRKYLISTYLPNLSYLIEE